MNSAKPILWVCLCLLLASAQRVPAQQPNPRKTPQVTGTATVAGHLEVEGSALAGITVMLQRIPDQPVVLTLAPPLTAVTDADGNYRFTRVPAGKYTLQAYAPVYVIERKEGAGGIYPDVVVEDGATIQNLDFKLRRGGVITGKLTDPDGRPLIEEMINLSRLDVQGKATRENMSPSALLAFVQRRTDDRGVYRIFGLEPGRYLVSAGGSPGPLGAMVGAKAEFKTTFFPGTVNQADARPVEVRGGSETENVDFALVRAETKKGYFASGRVIEADTGNPVTGVMVFYAANGTQPGSTGMGISNATTNSQGEFRFENLSPGSYSLTVAKLPGLGAGSGDELYAEAQPFEISSGDVTGLMLKMIRGATLSGTVVLEGPRDPQAATKLAGLMVAGMLKPDKVEAAADMMSMMSGMAMATTGPDGSFQLKGMRAGKYELRAQSVQDQTLKQIRLEQNGVPVETVEVTGQAPVVNVRLVLGVASASISGRVEVRGGTLPPGAQIVVASNGTTGSANAKQANTAHVDPGGKFNMSNLLPGVYELSVASIRLPGNPQVPFESPKQLLTLSDKARQEVVLYVDLKEKENEQ